MPEADLTAHLADDCVDLADVRAAADRIQSFVHRTPVLTCRAIDDLARRSLFFKCENFQRVGAFKMRGAANAVLQLARVGGVDESSRRSVVTHSSGNFAQALALAAQQQSLPAHIVMPTSAPRVKRDAVLGYGARVIDCAPTLEARESTAAMVIEETGGTLLHPYNHPHIIAGQGTTALELLADHPDLDTIVAPVGGGGLMAGICVAAHGLNRDITLIGAEPAGADDAARSLAAGHIIPQTNPDTIADGLLTSLGSFTFPVLRNHLDAIITVTDEQIIAAMRLVFARMKLVIEPSAAVPLAAVLTDEFQTRTGHQRIGIVLSGGNVDLDRLPW